MNFLETVIEKSHDSRIEAIEMVKTSLDSSLVEAAFILENARFLAACCEKEEATSGLQLGVILQDQFFTMRLSMKTTQALFVAQVAIEDDPDVLQSSGGCWDTRSKDIKTTEAAEDVDEIRDFCPVKGDFVTTPAGHVGIITSKTPGMTPIQDRCKISILVKGKDPVGSYIVSYVRDLTPTTVFSRYVDHDLVSYLIHGVAVVTMHKDGRMQLHAAQTAPALLYALMEVIVTESKR